MKRPIQIDGKPITWPDGRPFTRRDVVIVAAQWLISVAILVTMIGLTLANAGPHR